MEMPSVPGDQETQARNTGGDFGSSSRARPTCTGARGLLWRRGAGRGQDGSSKHRTRRWAERWLSKRCCLRTPAYLPRVACVKKMDEGQDARWVRSGLRLPPEARTLLPR